MASYLSCPATYTGPFQDTSGGDGEFYFYCFKPPMDILAPTVVELAPDVSYAGLFCPGATSYETITEGTMVYCDQPWQMQPGSVGAGGTWAELSAADIGSLLGAAVLLLVAAFAARVVIQQVKSSI